MTRISLLMLLQGTPLEFSLFPPYDLAAYGIR